MDSIAQVTNVGYYEDLATEDYYLKGGEPLGQWFGIGAEALGLKGEIESSHFSNLMTGFSPDGKTKLCQNAGSDSRAIAYDNVFSPSKSVSIAWAVAIPEEREKIQKAHDEAVEAALIFLEEKAAYTRRAHNGTTLEKLSGFLIGMYQHSTSREQDMHLHTHAVIMNLGQREDGTWGSIVGRFLYTWRTAASAIYQAHFAKEMTKLGYQVEIASNGKSFDIASVPQSICKHFSKRSMQIEEVMKEYGPGNRASKIGDNISKFTRNKKADIDRPALFSKWQLELAELGFNASKIKDIQKLEVEETETFDVSSLLVRLTENNSVFKECDLYREAAFLAMKTGHSGYQAQLLVQQAMEDENTIKLEIDAKNNVLFSTKHVLAAEKEMTSLAISLRNTTLEVGIKALAVLDKCNESSFQVSEEQMESVFEACSKNCLAIIQGSAGSGKTVSMKLVVDLYNDVGSNVIGAANTKAAAQNLEKQTKIQGFTITRLLGFLDSGKPPVSKNDVVIIDEAGMVGTFQMQELMRHARKIGFKLLLVGEDKQLDSIQHGGVLKYLSSTAIVGTKRINTIRRQNHIWDRHAVADFRDGYAEKALYQYSYRNQIQFGKNHEETLVLMIEAWKEYIKEDASKEYLMMAQRWELVQQLNTAARIHLKDLGRLGHEDIKVNGTVSDKSITFNISVGERVRLTKNDYKKKLTNGDVGTVIQLRQNIANEAVMYIRLDSGRVIKIRASEYCDEQGRIYLTPAYAQTVFSSQGLTINGETFVYYSSTMDRSNTYVACSRHKEKSTIFANKAELEEYIPTSHQHAPTKEKKLIAAMAACMTQENRPKLAIEYITKETEGDNIKEIELETTEQEYFNSLLC
jgi:conjugative relaxase-like TrwC/TraI family protein